MKSSDLASKFNFIYASFMGAMFGLFWIVPAHLFLKDLSHISSCTPSPLASLLFCPHPWAHLFRLPKARSFGAFGAALWLSLFWMGTIELLLSVFVFYSEFKQSALQARWQNVVVGGIVFITGSLTVSPLFFAGTAGFNLIVSWSGSASFDKSEGSSVQKNSP